MSTVLRPRSPDRAAEVTALVPLRYRVTGRREETADTVTLALEPVDRAIRVPLPGQFTMLYAYGVGEVPISVSGRTGAGSLRQTLRAVGAVTRALHASTPGTVLGVRGPFGTDWGLPAPAGTDVVVVAGGIGLAPLRPVVRDVLADVGRYRSVSLLIGARSPADLLYLDEYPAWARAGARLSVTVDRAPPGWTGHVGVVTTLFDRLAVDPAATTAFVCGPEAMMRFAARGLIDLGLPEPAIRLSIERNMRCGVVQCGHCQLGPLLLCRDGPVVGYDLAAPLLDHREL